MSSSNTVPPPRSLTTMQPFFRELAVNRETALALLNGLSATQLSWRPTEVQWGLAEICSHLATITSVYLPALDDAIQRGHADAAYSDRPFEGNTVSRLLVWSMEPPVRMRMRTATMLLPQPSEPPAQSRQNYRASQSAFELRLERAAGLDLAHISVRLPTMKRVRLSLGTVLALLMAHERRHLWQATVIRKSASFPRS